MTETRRTKPWEWFAYVCISVFVVVGSLYLGVQLPEALGEETIFFIFSTFFLFGLFFQRTRPANRSTAFWIAFSLFLLLHVCVVYKVLLFQEVFSTRNWSVAVIVEAVILEGASSKFNQSSS